MWFDCQGEVSQIEVYIKYHEQEMWYDCQGEVSRIEVYISIPTKRCVMVTKEKKAGWKFI